MKSTTIARGEWLPPGKQAAVCMTIDDVHPSTSRDLYEAGGDLESGALRHVAWLLGRHPQLHVTLFVTPDWRETWPYPTRRLLARLPILRDQLFLAPVLPKGTMRLDRHPEFVRYLRALPRVDLQLHGLHHVHRGPRVPVEFQNESRDECMRVLDEAMEIFNLAGLPRPTGMQAPAWDVPEALALAMGDLRLQYVAGARDIKTPIAPGALTDMSGPKGLSLFQPERLARGPIHFTSNFQATNPQERAFEILDRGGLFAVKCHIVKFAGEHVALDGVDRAYMSYLDLLFRAIDRRYGSKVWWTNMAEIAGRLN